MRALEQLAIALGQWGQPRHGYLQSLATSDHVFDKPSVRAEIAVVVNGVSQLMRFRKHPPNLRPESKRMRQHLKDDVSVLCAVAAITQCGQTVRVGGVICEREPATQRQLWVACIPQECIC